MIFISWLLELLVFFEFAFVGSMWATPCEGLTDSLYEQHGRRSACLSLQSVRRFCCSQLNNVSVLVISNIIRLYLLPEAEQDSMDLVAGLVHVCHVN